MSCLLSWHSNGFSAHFRKMKMYLRTCVRCHKKEEASITASLFSYLQKITKRSRSCITALLVINKKLAAKVCNFCHLTKFPRIFCRFILIFPDYYVINMITRFPSSTILLHGLLRTLIQYTTNNLTKLRNHHIAPSSMNTQANVWNVKCHQDNDSIGVQHLVLFSILRASALS